MSIQIASSGKFLTVTDTGTVRLTVHKRKTTIQIKGTQLHITHQGIYAYECEFSDVSSPATANIEALRVSVESFLKQDI